MSIHKRHARLNRNGYTIIELLVVLTIVSLLVVIAVSTFQNLKRSSILRVSVDNVQHALETARNRTLASDGDTVFGIHLDEDKMVVFSGISYSSTSPTNTDYEFTGGVTATSSLSGGVTEIIFARLTGVPNATGTITLVTPGGFSSSTLEVFSSGLIE